MGTSGTVFERRKTIKLFNGKNLDGWTAFFQGGSTDPSEAFFVEDGILKCKGRPIGYLLTKKKYTSYELVIEWRFNQEKGAFSVSRVLLHDHAVCFKHREGSF